MMRRTRLLLLALLAVVPSSAQAALCEVHEQIMGIMQGIDEILYLEIAGADGAERLAPDVVRELSGLVGRMRTLVQQHSAQESDATARAIANNILARCQEVLNVLAGTATRNAVEGPLDRLFVRVNQLLVYCAPIGENPDIIPPEIQE